jgi:1-acyl-sn-glycerol-3-phosphate acyltransferase
MATERLPDPVDKVEQKVLAILREFVAELGMGRTAHSISLDALLDRDLGLGSLERVELILRIEKGFSVHIPEHLIAEAGTPRDLARAVLQAETPGRPLSLERIQTIGAATPPPESASSLVEVLLSRAEREAERPHIYLPQEDGSEQKITYGQLVDAAGAVAQGLLEQGLRRYETVALMLPTGSDFFFTFFGALFAGGIPVPLYPPVRMDQIEEYARRQVAILKKADARFLITSGRVEGLGHLLQPMVPSLTDVTTFEALSRASSERPKVELRSEDPALIQFTSGSTGLPKGVLLAHENVLANIRAIGQAAQIGPGDACVSWLPLYHDMGLIGSWLGALYYGIPITILSPLTFLARPERWLWAIHYHRGTHSAAPNFAYELCVRKIDDRAIEGIDLSSWRVAFNGAEPVSPDTIDRFTKRFAPYGFRKETLFPVYGLAESSVALTFPPVGRPPRIDAISRETFERHRRAEPAPLSESAPLRFVSCGVPLPGHEVRIVDESGEEVKERIEGSLQFRGPSTMRGYYRDPEATEKTFQDGWCDSGDFAYRADGEIFVTGRRKDMIIKAGRNLYPQEVEEVVGEIPGIRKGRVAAFGITDPEIGTEKLVVVAETRAEKEEARRRLIGEVMEKVAAATDIRPDIVSLVPSDTIPKTSSGKLRRAALRSAYLKGKMGPPRRPAALQIARLWLAGLGARMKRASAALGRGVYTGYVATIALLTIPPVWIAMFLLPAGALPARLSRAWARRFFSWIGCPVTVKGSDPLSQAGPSVLVANHSGYLDAIVLMAALPPRFLFVAKRELMQAPIIRTVIKRVGHLTVDRLDFAESVTTTRRIEEAIGQGHSVLIFPEGTFSRIRGIRPFRLGAFKVAVETGRPICPIAIRGAREVLWPGRWIPRRGAIQVFIGKPIRPEGSDWREIVRLRDLAKSEIVRHAGEPPIDLVAAGIAKE